MKLCLAAVLSLGLTAAAPLAISSFVQAPAGLAVAFAGLELPAVKIPGNRPPPPFTVGGAFGPSYTEILTGNLVITSQAQMQAVWNAVLSGPYQPSLFDFSKNFVLWMGGNSLQLGSFGISAVEQVNAQWSDPMVFAGPGVVEDAFLAVTSTTFTPGAFPQDPPPPTYRVSAVQVDRAYLDDVAFHSSFVFAP
jgi:hypothetical protein